MIKVEDLRNFTFLSNPQTNPSRTLAAFVVSNSDYEQNKYINKIYTFDGQALKPLTEAGNETDFLFEDEKNILFKTPEKNRYTAQTEAESKRPLTHYYRINVDGGEAAYAFSIPLDVEKLWPLNNNGKFLVLASYDLNYPDLWQKTPAEQEEICRHNEETAFCRQIHEIPFQANGTGYLYNRRSALFFFDAVSEELELIGEDYPNYVIKWVSLNNAKTKALFAATCYEGNNEYRYCDFAKLYEVDLENCIITPLYEQLNQQLGDGFYVETVNQQHQASGHEIAVLISSDTSGYGLNENNYFYVYDRASSQLQKISDYEIIYGNSVGSDVAYGCCQEKYVSLNYLDLIETVDCRSTLQRFFFVEDEVAHKITLKRKMLVDREGAVNAAFSLNIAPTVIAEEFASDCDCECGSDCKCGCQSGEPCSCECECDDCECECENECKCVSDCNCANDCDCNGECDCDDCDCNDCKCENNCKCNNANECNCDSECKCGCQSGEPCSCECECKSSDTCTCECKCDCDDCECECECGDCDCGNERKCESDCNSDNECNCGSDCKCGCQSGEPCSCRQNHSSLCIIGFYQQNRSEIYLVHNPEKLQRLTYFNSQNLSTVKPLPLTITSRFDREAVNGYVLLPPDFRQEARASYPLILDIHGGPKTVYGSTYYHEMQVWANLGFVVCCTNPHGSDGRGNKFADIRRAYGQQDYDDLMDFLDAVLKTYPQIDSKRLGVTGGSYGGFMTNWIITHTKRFQAACTQRSISNWLSFCGTSDIGYLFATDQNKVKDFSLEDQKTLWEHSPLHYINNAVTPTLIIHSDADYRCPYEQGMQLHTALTALGVPNKLCVFHEENHELSRSGRIKAREQRLNLITHWFLQYLQADNKELIQKFAEKCHI